MSYSEFINLFPDFSFLKPLFDSNRIFHKKWEKGKFICQSNQNLKDIIFFTSGRGKVYKSLHNGKDVMYKVYGSGDIAGDVEYILKCNTACCLQSTDNLTGFRLPISSLTAEISMELFVELSKVVSEKFLKGSNQQAFRLGYTLEERLAFYLLNEYRDGVTSMEELAAVLGTTYRHLSRVFKKFSNSGLLKLNNKIVEIKDRQGLIAMSYDIEQDQA